MSKYFIGLMTGTSADSIDGVWWISVMDLNLYTQNQIILKKTISQNMRKLLKRDLRKKR